MQLNINALDTHLSKQLSSLYLISSDELLFIEEARNKIILAARKKGFIDREIMHAENSFQWEHFTQSAQNISLFSDKKIIDLRNHSAKFDAKGADALLNYIEKINQDTIVIISTQKLSSALQKSKWFKATEKSGVYLPIFPIKTNEYPQWIQQRGKKSGLSVTIDAAKLLTQATEGHLFAAAQAIDKCALLYPDDTITPEKIGSVISDSTQYTVFDLSNAILSGDAKRSMIILRSLEKTGAEPILALWAITKEVRELLQISYQTQRGIPMQQALASIWASKKALVQHALKRLNTSELQNALENASSIDMMLKGAKTGNPWQALTDICLLLCNKKILSMNNE